MIEGDKSGAIAALLGGGLLMIGPFMPWVTLGMLSASGMDKTGSEAFVLVLLGLVALAAGISGLNGKVVSRGIAALGLIAGAMVAFYASQIFSSLSDAPTAFSVSPGFGIYATGFGAMLVIASPFLGLKVQQASSAPPASMPCPDCQQPMTVGAWVCAQCGYKAKRS